MNFTQIRFSTLLGLFIGIDRRLKNKPLGVKTSMVISVASCLITMVSIESVHVYSVQDIQIWIRCDWPLKLLVELVFLAQVSFYEE